MSTAPVSSPTATRAIERVATSLDVCASHAVTGRWRTIVARRASLEQEAALGFDRLLDDLVPALLRPDVPFDEAPFGGLHVMTRRIEATIDALSATEPETRLDESMLVVRHARVDMASVARRCASPLTGVMQNRGTSLRLRLEEGAFAEVDPEKVELAMCSLLLDACQRVAPGGRLELVVESRPSFVEVRLSTGPLADTGDAEPGSRQRKPALRLARHLVRLSGGTLLEEHLGATLRARLPIHAPSGVALHPTATLARGTVEEVGAPPLPNRRRRVTPARRAAKPRVLLVARDPVVHQSMVQGLRPKFETRSAFECEQARIALERERYDLVILDLSRRSPDDESDVEDAWTRWRSSGAPVLMVVGEDDPRDPAARLAAGAADVLVTPIFIPELVARATNLVEARRSRRALRDRIGQHETDLLSLASSVAERQRMLDSTLAELDAARRAAESAGRAQVRVFRMVSHELRTPITAIELQLRLLERGVDAGPPNELRDGLDRIARSSRRLSHLVDMMLVWARIESDSVELNVESVDVEATIREAVDDLSPYAAHKGIVIDVRRDGELGAIMTDKAMVRLVVVSLLNRAIQLTASGDVRIVVGPRPAGAHITIVDRGPKLSADEHAMLTSPHDAIDDVTRQTGAGSGFDLHIVRDIARTIHACVAIGSDEHVGNVLSIELGSCTPSDLASCPCDPSEDGGDA